MSLPVFESLQLTSRDTSFFHGNCIDRKEKPIIVVLYDCFVAQLFEHVNQRNRFVSDIGRFFMARVRTESARNSVLSIR